MPLVEKHLPINKPTESKAIEKKATLGQSFLSTSQKKLRYF